MFKYSIFSNDGTNITFMINDDLKKLITVNIVRDFYGYEINHNYYIDNFYNIEKISGEHNLIIYKNKKTYTKLEQYEFDRYNTRYPICSNGQLYRHLLDYYYKLYK